MFLPPIAFQSWLLATAVIPTACMVGVALLCVLQFAYFARKLAIARDESARATNRAHENKTEIVELQRDRTIGRLENRILCEFIGQTDIKRAVALLLRRFVPNPRDGLCGVIQFHADEATLLDSRGISEQAMGDFQMRLSLRNRIRNERVICLTRSQFDENGLSDFLSRRDRKKIERLHFIAADDKSKLSFALMTTELYPVGATHQQRVDLAQHLITNVARSVLRMQSFEGQRNELRAANERMTLRSIADKKHESPTDMMHEFLTRLLEMVGGDRIAFFLSQPDADSECKLLCRCGVELQPGAKVRWQFHEKRIVEVCSGEPGLKELDRRQLTKIGVGTLIGRAISVNTGSPNTTTTHVCCTRKRPDEFSRSEWELLSWAASHLSAATHRWLSLLNFERQARRDSLTDLANRREFDERIEVELQRAASKNVCCSLLLFDLDRFKNVNDTLGHQAGDYVLKKCADVLRENMKNIRDSDRALLSRYGGEEFAVLVPDIPERGAVRIAESLRRAVEQTEFDFEEIPIRVTMSGGVASADTSAMSATELFSAADAALYASKESGRNRITCASELTAHRD